MDLMARRRMMMEVGGSPTPPAPTLVFYDYLYFDGTAYVETDVTVPSLASFAVSLGEETGKKAQRVFRVRGSGTGNFIQFNYTTSTNTTRRNFGIYYGTSSNIAGTRNLNWTTKTFNFFLTPNRYGYGSNSWTISKGDGYPQNGISLGGFSGDTGNPYTGRMGIFRVYGSDAQNATTYSGITAFTPVATFRPCTYNGEAGMWYVEGNKFYGNSAGAGTLTASNS